MHKLTWYQAKFLQFVRNIRQNQISLRFIIASSLNLDDRLQVDLICTDLTEVFDRVNHNIFNLKPITYKDEQLLKKLCLVPLHFSAIVFLYNVVHGPVNSGSLLSLLYFRVPSVSTRVTNCFDCTLLNQIGIFFSPVINIIIITGNVLCFNRYVFFISVLLPLRCVSDVSGKVGK